MVLSVIFACCKRLVLKVNFPAINDEFGCYLWQRNEGEIAEK